MYASNRSVHRWRGLGLLCLLVVAPALMATNVSVNVTVNYSNGSGSSLNILDDVSGVWYNLYQSGGLNGSGTIGPVSVSATVGTGLLIGATGSANTEHTTEQTVNSAGQNFTFTFSFTGGANQQQSVPWYWNATISNYDPTPKVWKLKDPNGNVVASGTVAGYSSGSGSYSTTGTSAPSGYTMGLYDPSGASLGSSSAGGWSTSNGGSPNAVGSDATPYADTTSGKIGTNIVWTDGTTGALDSTLKTGFGLLYSAENDNQSVDQNYMNGMLGQLGGMASSLTQVHNDITSLQNANASGFSGLQSTLNVIQGNVAPLSGQLTTANNGLNTLHADNAGMISDLNGIASSSSAAASSAASTASGVSSLNTALGAFQSQNHSDLAGVQGAIANLQSATTVDPRPNIDAVKSAVNQVDTDLNAGVSSINGNLGTISSTLQAHGNTLSAISSTETSNNGLLGQINTGVGNVNSALAGVAKDSTLSGVNTTLQGVRSDLATANQTLNGVAHDSTVQGVRSDLTTINTSLGGINSTLNTQIGLNIGAIQTADAHAQAAATAAYNEHQILDVDLNAGLGNLASSGNLNAGNVVAAVNAANNSISGKGDVLHNDNQQFSHQNHGDLGAINGTLGTIASELQNPIDPRPNIDGVTSAVNGMKSDVDTRLDGANGWLQRIEGDVNPLHNDVQQVHTDLVGLTNQLKGLPKAFDDYANVQLAGKSFDANSAQASAQAAAKPLGDRVNGAQTALGNSAAGLPDPTGDLDDSFWSAQLPIIGSVVTFDFNPLHSEWLGPLVPAIYTAILWVVTYLYLFACYKVAEANLQHLTPYQARTAGTSVLGNNANALSALGMAGLISLALAAVPAVFIAWFASPAGTYAFSTILASPITGVMGASVPAREGVKLLSHFIPVNVIITDALLYLGFRMGFGGVYFVARQIMLWLVGL